MNDAEEKALIRSTIQDTSFRARLFAITKLLYSDVISSRDRVTGHKEGEAVFTKNDLNRFALKVLYGISDRTLVNKELDDLIKKGV